jgi:hypothetical protein
VTEIPGRNTLCLLPSADGLLVGTDQAELYRLRDGTVERIREFEDVEDRNRWYTPWGAPPDTRSLSQTADGAVLANIHVGGVVRSADGGASWQPTMDIDADCHHVLAHPGDPERAYAATAIGLGVSIDGGRSWSFETRGLHATYQRALAVGKEWLLVSCSRSERGVQAAIYRRSLEAGGPLARCTEGLPEWFDDNINTGCIATRGRQSAIGTVDGRVFISRDDGASWELMEEGLPKIRCLVLAP